MKGARCIWNPRLVASCLLLSLLVGFSCADRKGEQISFLKFPQAQWSATYSPSFVFFVPSREECFDVEVILRLNNDFAPLSLPLHYQITNDYGFIKAKEIVLEVGQGAGDVKSIKGSFRQLGIVLEHDLSFPHAGIYQLTLSHQLPVSVAEGVENIGVKISRR